MLDTQAVIETPQSLGLNAEKNVMVKLRAQGLPVIKMPHNSRFDLLVGDKRIEVKAAKFGLNGLWRFNIHRHGKLDESGVDAYVFVLHGLPHCGPMPLYMVFPAPLGKKVIRISLPSLIRKLTKYVDGWDLIGMPQCSLVEL